MAPTPSQEAWQKPEKRLSIREVATRLGISKSTASLALSKQAEECPLAPATRQRIIKAARAMGYRPNSIARTMRTGRFDTIAMLVGSVTPRYLPSGLLYGAEQELGHRGNQLIFAWLNDEWLTSEERIPKVLEQWASDGLLIHYTHRFPKRMRELIDRYRVPSIWVNTKLERDCIYPDDENAARQATQRLIELGHRRIAYVNFSRHGHYSEIDRRAGYQQAMAEAGLTPRSLAFKLENNVMPTCVEPDARHRLAEQLLDDVERATAYVCYETRVAGPILAAAQRRGWSVPGDLSLITFSQTTRNDTGVSLATMFISMEDVGRRAAAMVLERVAHPDQPQKAATVPLSWVEGATVGPPRGDEQD